MMFVCKWSHFFFTGSIPLRQLVYRVHPLPESMRPLVWDFGQLTHHTEELYTKQIVRRFVVAVTPGVSIAGQRIVNKTRFINAICFKRNLWCKLGYTSSATWPMK